jgi:hypothetical protein
MTSHREAAHPPVSGMAWLAWRQHRAVLLCLVGFAVAQSLVMLGSVLTIRGIAACAQPDTGTCGTTHQLALRVGEWSVASTGLLPIFIGAFIGAPLVAREYEQGTFVLAWTQQVTVRRWVTAKVLILAAIMTLSLVPVALVSTLLIGQLSRVEVTRGYVSKFGTVPFEAASPLILAYAWFALVCGTALGILVKRVVPAIGLAIFLVTTVRLGVRLARPRFLPPLHKVGAGRDPVQVGRNALVINGNAWGDSHGTVHAIPARCITSQQFEACTNQLGITNHVTLYQPASRLVLFQTVEFASFALLAALMLLVISMWADHTSPRPGRSST